MDKSYEYVNKSYESVYKLRHRKNNKIKYILNCKIINKMIIVSIILLMGLMQTGCGKNKESIDQTDSQKALTKIYYVDANGTKIVSEDYQPIGTTKKELVKEYLKALSTDPTDINMKKAKPDSVTVDKFYFNEDGILTINFNSNYSMLTGVSEILCRATIVKTLTQIKDVDYVEFYVNGMPLMGANDKPVGFMRNSDFIDNTDAEEVYVKVYYSNKEGNALIESNLKITYKGNRSIEQLIIQQLINGPVEKNMIKTLPEGTELIKVTTKDNICYVDFNKAFLNKVPGIDDNVVIYSVVNSLDELSSINKVQFTIDGAAKATYGDGIAFDGLFERNLEIVEGSK
jgi:germination protein M